MTNRIDRQLGYHIDDDRDVKGSEQKTLGSKLGNVPKEVSEDV